MKNIIYHQAVTRITSSFQTWKLSPMASSSKWFTCTIAYKLEVVRYAKEHGNRAAERHFGPLPTEKMIQQWRKQEELGKFGNKTKHNLYQVKYQSPADLDGLAPTASYLMHRLLHSKLRMRMTVVMMIQMNLAVPSSWDSRTNKNSFDCLWF